LPSSETVSFEVADDLAALPAIQLQAVVPDTRAAAAVDVRRADDGMLVSSALIDSLGTHGCT